jgi:hypothetical protein
MLYIVLLTVLLGVSPPSISLAGCTALDGDTLRCGRVSIRLTGFDAVETCERGGPQATTALQGLVREGITLTFVGRDRYGRVLAQGETRQGTVAERMRPWWRDRRVPRPTCRVS